VVVETVVLEQVDDVQFLDPVLARVAYVELEPLGVAASVLVGF